MIEYDNDIDYQVPNNYTYDEIGNMIKNVAKEIEQIQWFVNVNIKAILLDQQSSKPNLYFDYGPDGQRVRKRLVANAGTGAISETWYIRDAQGNVMANYDYTIVQDNVQTAREFYLYGSRRLGSHTIEMATSENGK